MMTDTRIAAPIATLTAATGVAEWMKWIPNDIGKLATLVGIILSVVLIISHTTKGIIAVKKYRNEAKNNPATDDRRGQGDRGGPGRVPFRPED